MRVADKQVNGDRSIRELLHDLQSQRADSSSGIEDEDVRPAS
jgi:hypothetical protein